MLKNYKTDKSNTFSSCTHISTKVSVFLKTKFNKIPFSGFMHGRLYVYVFIYMYKAYVTI